MHPSCIILYRGFLLLLLFRLLLRRLFLFLFVLFFGYLYPVVSDIYIYTDTALLCYNVRN